VPELAWDNQTTIRPPMVRRKRDEDQNRNDRGASFGEAAGRLRDREPAAKAPAPRAQAPESGRYGTGERAAGRSRVRAPEGAPRSRPAEPRVERRRPRAESAPSAPRAREAAPRREPVTKAAPAPRAHAAPRAQRPARDEGAKAAPPAEKRSGARRRE
jgi:translation initiation factor IF-2